jgi:hypothetical protein
MKKGKGNAGMPKEHYEKGEGKLGHTSNLRYAESEMGNPQELDRRNSGLASYVKSKKSKQS